MVIRVRSDQNGDCAEALTAPCAEFELGDGRSVWIRPVRPDDKARIQEGFGRMSVRNRYLRFFSGIPELTAPMLTAMTEVDGVDRFAWIALTREDEHDVLVGVARYVRLDDPRVAEVALTVVDPYQGHGIGHLLLDALVLEALRVGVTRFEGQVLSDNSTMRAVLSDVGARMRFDEPATLHLEIDLPAREQTLRATPMYARLRRITAHP